MAQILFVSGAGGPPPPASLDRFAPKYLVGNVPAGDSNLAYSAAGFTYIADPGDGSGIRAALLAAQATPGDVWIRPGQYLLAARDLPLTVPPRVRVQGAGDSTYIARTSTSSYCGVFVLQDRAELRDCYIDVTNTSSELLDLGVVSVLLTEATAQLERVRVVLSNDSEGAYPLSALYTAGTVVADRCLVTVGGESTGDPRTGLLGLTGARSNGRLVLDACELAVATASFADAAVVAGDPDNAGRGLRLEQTRCSGFASGIVGFDCDLILVGSEVIADKQGGVYLRGTSLLRIGSSTVIAANNIIGSVGVDVDVSLGQITGSTIRGTTGISSLNATGAGIAIGFNTIIASGTHVSAQPVDEVAHNIFL